MASAVIIVTWALSQGLGMAIVWLVASDFGLSFDPVSKLTIRVFSVSVFGLVTIISLISFRSLRYNVCRSFVRLFAYLDHEKPPKNIQQIVNDEAWLKLGGGLIVIDLVSMLAAYLSYG